MDIRIYLRRTLLNGEKESGLTDNAEVVRDRGSLDRHTLGLEETEKDQFVENKETSRSFIGFGTIVQEDRRPVRSSRTNETATMAMVQAQAKDKWPESTAT